MPARERDDAPPRWSRYYAAPAPRLRAAQTQDALIHAARCRDADTTDKPERLLLMRYAARGSAPLRVRVDRFSRYAYQRTRVYDAPDRDHKRSGAKAPRV